MDITEAIAAARLHMRRDIWFETADWKTLLNQACMEFQGQTHMLERDFSIALTENAPAYDLSEERIYRLTEDAKYAEYDAASQTWSYTKVRRKSRAELDEILGADWYTETGTPLYIYPIGVYSIGVYPVPAAAQNGQFLYVHGCYHPEEITAATLDSTELPFEVIDHPTIVMGVCVLANRIDKSIVLSRDIEDAYTKQVMAARSRKMGRLGTGSKMRTHGR